MLQKAIPSFLRLLWLNLFLFFIARIAEYFWLNANHQVESLFKNEFLGFCFDVLIIHAVSVILFFIYAPVYHFFPRVAWYKSIVLSFLVFIIHVSLLQYFIRVMIPLDKFFYKYTPDEVMVAIKTGEVNYFPVFTAMILGIAAGAGFLWMTKKIPLTKRIILIQGISALASIPLFFIGWNNIYYHREESVADIRMNKSFYFYCRSFEHFFLDEDFKQLQLEETPVKEYQATFSPGHHYVSEEHPLLHTTETRDVLAPFFKKSNTRPDVVVLIMEGMSDEFLHNYHGISAMPFVDSLSQKSLYWNRFFTAAERSFAAVPSIIGSLPYGENGFNFMDRLPRHISLASWMKQQHYHTAFYIAQGAWFHENDKFFKKNNASLIFDKDKFDKKYKKVISGSDNFFWGYHDKDLYDQVNTVMKTLPSPRLDIIFSGSMHSPYAIADEAYYTRLLNKKMDDANVSQKDREFLLTYKKYVLTLLFTNDALKEFFEEQKNLPSYENTIYVITGDHPMTELPIANSLKRYHVPLIIYSPLLERRKTFSCTGSHLDIFPTLMAFLHHRYHLDIPGENSALGGILDTLSEYRYSRPVVFMNDNREMIDFFWNNYFLSNEKLVSKVDENFELTPVEDEQLFEEMRTKLDYFRKVNYYVSFNDKIVPEDVFYRSLKTEMIFSKTLPELRISKDMEFTELCPVKKIPAGKNIYFDLSADVVIEGDSAKVPQGTYAITDENDSTLLWQSFSFIPWQKQQAVDHHLLIKIPATEKNAKFVSHIWNEKKGQLLLKNVVISVYAEEAED